jgi:hypothetical protein
MKGLFGFLAGSMGRGVRAVAGVILILVGLFAIGGLWGWVLAIVGLAPLAAGVFDFCIFAPLFGLPFGGAALREALKK